MTRATSAIVKVSNFTSCAPTSQLTLGMSDSDNSKVKSSGMRADYRKKPKSKSLSIILAYRTKVSTCINQVGAPPLKNLIF